MNFRHLFSCNTIVHEFETQWIPRILPPRMEARQISNVNTTRQYIMSTESHNLKTVSRKT